MKANQAFKANDEAVSPVIGVILMVAITVVLAAVVFVLVSNLSKGSNNSAPTLAINTDDTADRLVITSAATGADWSRLTIKATSCTTTSMTNPIVYVGAAAMGASPHFNVASGTVASTTVAAISAAGTAPSCGAAVPVQISTTSVPIAAGDFVELCSNVATTNVNVDLVDTVANSAVGSYVFTSIAVCA